MQTETDVLANLSHLGLLQVSGEGAKKLLQGQLTCDLEQVTTIQSQLGAHCNPQGRVISFFRIFQRENNYYLSMPSALVPIALAALQKYAVFFKVNLTDVTAQLQQLGYYQPTQGFQFFIGDQAELQAIEHSFGPSIKKITPEEWQACFITQGFPAIYPETTAKFLPHELNLPELNAVSFTKGCYTGQEIIARMQYRGKLKNRLYLAQLRTATLLSHGQDIYRDSIICGNIVDFCAVEYNTYKVLVIAPENDVQTKTLHIGTDRLEF